jgi:phosphopentomutase
VRALLLVLDSVGVGEAPGAAKYGETGANTLVHILERTPDLQLPNLESLGLHAIPDRKTRGKFRGSFGRMREKSAANILYTSADSVMQIAAHEDVMPVPRLYEICQIARRHCDRWRIGRVIARPFDGEPGSFRRTARRHDFSMMPPATILNALHDAGRTVTGVGKISDIFAGSGISQSYPTASNREGMQVIDQLWKESRDGLIFANLVDFDILFGHRRDVAGYARALKEFDRWLGTFLSRVKSDDLVIITADNGNDPIYRGTDHTREEVPLFVLNGAKSQDLGTRRTFADVAATLAQYFKLLEYCPAGASFLDHF